MRKYEKYVESSVTTCHEDEAVFGSLCDQSCRLARARGKPGYIRVSEFIMEVGEKNVSTIHLYIIAI